MSNAAIIKKAVAVARQCYMEDDYSGNRSEHDYEEYRRKRARNVERTYSTCNSELEWVNSLLF